MNLFLDQAPEFAKQAAFAARLSEQPDNWPQELNSEIFKQLPFLSDYQVDVHLDRTDPQKGFAFGYADVSNKTERPEAEHPELGIPHIRIPIIVMDRSMKPLSVFLDGEKVLPLTEERLRQHLFNPSTFDLSTAAPRDPSLVEPLMPPQRSGIGMGGEYKMASVKEAFAPMTPSQQPAMAKGGPAQRGQPALAKGGPRPTSNIISKVTDRLKMSSISKEAFQHISKEQWQALYGSMDIKKMVDQYGSVQHPAVQNKIYEMAAKIYGYHPKPEPPPPSAMEAYHKKKQEKSQKDAEKMQSKAQKMMADGQKMMGKQGSALLLEIAPTMREEDINRFYEKVASDKSIVAGLKAAGITPVLVEAIDHTKRASAEERLEAVAEAIEPTVVTIQKLPGGNFLVKSANVNAFAPDQAAQGQTMPQEEVAPAMGEDNAQQMMPGQTATAVSAPSGGDIEQMSRNKPIDEFGQYKVEDSMGNSLLGHVFPHTLAWDGNFTPQPVALFTNGSAYAIQENISGEFVGKGTNLPVDEPRGDGVFYTVKNGEGIATGPITVGSSVAGPDGLPKFVGTDAFGNQVQVSKMAGLKQPMRVADNEYALPEDWEFMRLNNQTQLVQDPGAMGQEDAVKQAQSSITMFYNGAYNLEGGCGLHKLSSDFRHDLDPVSAEFMLGLLGVDGALAKMKVAECRKKGSIKLGGLYTITLLSERFAESEKTASALYHQFREKLPNIQRDLIKEASYLGDADTADKVLALNFINPENLTTFINYIPELEECSEKLAEMLLYSYIGMREIPEVPVERAMKNLEDVTQSLKSVANVGG